VTRKSSFQNEKKMQHRFPKILAWVLLFLTILITGCGSGSPVITSPVLTETISPIVPEALPTETASPTATQATDHEISELSEVILLSPPDADSELASTLESTLTELASSEGLKFERRASLDPGELNPDTHLVVGLAPDPGLTTLADLTPQVQFLGIEIPGITAGANISTISAQGSISDQLGFLAGYLAAMVTPEWRVGVIAPSDTPAGTASRQGFMRGVVFFCGLCRQTYPPYVTYPLYVELPSSASSSEWQAAAQVLVDQSVQTVYLAPGADSEELSNYLGKAGVNIIANSSPPAGLDDHWIATLQADPAGAVRDIWPSLIAGGEGRAAFVPLSATHINEEILTPGRMRLLEEMIANLEAGYIDPSVRPADGDQTP
jgi:hypothetical protein